MQIYGLKNCDTCRKAKKALPNAEFLDVRVDGIEESVLRKAFDQFGDALVNKKSTTWRGLDDVEREQDPIMLLKAHPSLMKRTLIRGEDGTFHLGWTTATQEALGL